MKPNKSILKRIKITKTGKLIRRKAGQNHFRAKASRRVKRRQASAAAFPRQWAREIKQRLH